MKFMSKEKLIKGQAREALRGNWTPVLFAAAMLISVYLMIEYGQYLVGVVFNLIDPETEDIREGRELLYYLVVSAGSAALMLLSPLANGFLKLFASITVEKKAEFSTVFYYFKRIKLYLKTLVFNLILLLVNGALIFALDFYNYASILMDAKLSDDRAFGVVTIALAAAFLASLIMGFIILLLFAYYPLAAYAFNDTLPLKSYTVNMLGFSVKRFGAALRLTASFLGWFALCFFVVPAMYVIPYYICAVMTSSMWLFKLEGERGIVC